MSRRSILLIYGGILAACLILAVVFFIRGGAQRREALSRWRALDKNSDGYLTADELPNKEVLRRLDRDGDSRVSMTEARALIQGLRDLQSKRQEQATNEWVTRNDLTARARESFEKAEEHSSKNRGMSVLVMVDGKIVFEQYANGGTNDLPLEIASGTKSFCGVIAAACVEDGLFRFDDKVSDTIEEWRNDPGKSSITIRQLLTLTSGLDSGSAAGDVPTYASALRAPVIGTAGEKFRYDSAPFQVFGELMKRRLRASNESAVDFLKRRVLDPLGLQIGGWKTGSDGNPHLPSGARLTAREWGKLGELVRNGGSWNGKQVIRQDLLDECFQGTSANPAYGIAWWLNREVDKKLRSSIPQLAAGTEDLWGIPGIPDDLVFAAGAGKQRLYVSRARRTVIVRQAGGVLQSLAGDRGGFSDVEFLSLMFQGIKDL
jgi:CubicO group peptidase (beta-lactamase class C family)